MVRIKPPLVGEHAFPLTGFVCNVGSRCNNLSPRANFQNYQTPHSEEVTFKDLSIYDGFGGHPGDVTKTILYK